MHQVSHEMSTHPPIPPGCLVILNGFPGVGKLTIARALQSRLTNAETRLIDNHLIIDPAEAVHPGRGLQHKRLRDKLRRVIFDELKTVPEQDTVLIMTCSLGANVEDAAVFAEYLGVSRSCMPSP
jgi:chloramphenicol 3-O-phosphotransferase